MSLIADFAGLAGDNAASSFTTPSADSPEVPPWPALGDALGTTYEFERIEQPGYPMLAT